jgi:hypothetical protein
MSSWLKERFSDPNRAMDTICAFTGASCVIVFVLTMILLAMVRLGVKV